MDKEINFEDAKKILGFTPQEIIEVEKAIKLGAKFYTMINAEGKQIIYLA